ncbi:MAG: helix-turn-helix domain-containing protein [Rhodobacteraceae bacterium]|nr:helix-turn-helix domain-containing protein [Paracoccaceae bacterium]
MTTEQAAAYLSVSAGTMRNWRSRGDGPRYHLLGGRLVRYEVEDLDAYMRDGAA